MSVARTVLTIAFLLFAGITLFFPSFPPAASLYEYVGIPPTTTYIWGIAIATLLNAITNGFFWTIIAAAGCGLVQISLTIGKVRPLRPMPVAPHLATRPPENPLVDTRVTKIPPALTIPPGTQSFITKREPASSVIKTKTSSLRLSKQPVRTEIDVETIAGIGPVYGRILRVSGVETVNDFLRLGATEHAQYRLARELGVTPATVRMWIYRGKLLRLRSMRREGSL